MRNLLLKLLESLENKLTESDNCDKLTLDIYDYVDK